MQIQHLLIDDIQIDSSSLAGIVNSVRYDFNAPEWISSHRERQGAKLGPMTLLEPNAQYVPVTFPERKLVTEGPPARSVFHFMDTWTIPSRTVYVISIPRGYIVDGIELISTRGKRIDTSNYGMSDSGQLFNFFVFEQECTLNVAALILRNEAKYNQFAQSVDVVKNSNWLGRYFNGLFNRLISPEFISDVIANIAGNVLSGKS